MIYKVLVLLHLLGAAVWVGGHIALVRAVLPRALRERDASLIIHFERGFRKVALLALLIQLVTGLMIAPRWIGSWQSILSEPTPASQLVLAKLGLLIVTAAIAGHAHHRILPRLTDQNLNTFAWHARAISVMAVLMLILGASIRLGGLF